jgi:hypothetical protein
MMSLQQDELELYKKSLTNNSNLKISYWCSPPATDFYKTTSIRSLLRRMQSMFLKEAVKKREKGSSPCLLSKLIDILFHNNNIISSEPAAHRTTIRRQARSRNRSLRKIKMFYCVTNSMQIYELYRKIISNLSK